MVRWFFMCFLLIKLLWDLLSVVLHRPVHVFFFSGYTGHSLRCRHVLFFFYLTLKSALVQKNIVKFYRKWMWLWKKRCHFHMGKMGSTGYGSNIFFTIGTSPPLQRRLPPWSTLLPSERLLRQRSILARLWPCYIIVRAIVRSQDVRKVEVKKTWWNSGVSQSKSLNKEPLLFTHPWVVTRSEIP